MRKPDRTESTDNTDLINASKLMIPVIAHNFEITERKLLSTNEHEAKYGKKLLIFCATHYFDIPVKTISDYYRISKRTVWRYLRFVNRIIFADENTIEYKAYREFIIRSKKTVRYIQENYLQNGNNKK